MKTSIEQLREKAHVYNSLTPMMRQYYMVKSQYLDYILFYRMGDFYEMFFDDAVLCSEKLDIVLTKRGKMEDTDIPMCGIPFHSSEVYVQKLVKLGYKIAICEQTETPEEAKKRGYKALVSREVIRIITPGTVLEDTLLSSKEENNLCCIYKDQNNGGRLCIAWIDITIGVLYVEVISQSSVNIEIARLSPKEIIISHEDLKEMNIEEQVEKYNGYITLKPKPLFEFNKCESKLKSFYKVKFLSGISNFKEGEVIAIGVLLEYIEHTQKANIPLIRKIERVSPQHFMSIDYNTRINLELEKSQFSDRKKTLLGTIDKTLTASGGRLLRSMLSSPLADHIVINSRLDNVEFFFNNVDIRNNVRTCLKDFPDIERILSRISGNRGRPIDLLLIKNGLDTVVKLSDSLLGISCNADMTRILGQINSLGDLRGEIKVAVQHDITTDKVEYATNGIFRAGYRLDLDKMYSTKNGIDSAIDNLRTKYQQLSGIQHLRVIKNKLIGLFIEITPSNASKMTNSVFIHKQTLTTAVRYTTKELQELETMMVSIDLKIEMLEIEILNHLYKRVIDNADQISLTTNSIATIDVASSLAEVAFRNKYVRPIVDRSNCFIIRNGRHPVVESILKEKFHPNDCVLSTDGDCSTSGSLGKNRGVGEVRGYNDVIEDGDYGTTEDYDAIDVIEDHDSLDEDFSNNLISLITGPNMAGKSTFLRQNAIICILAQIGSFVPADYVKIGVVDKLFSRIGSGDNISYGQSTFMMEMLETAYILNNATSKSLIILDEIGRGTSTYDGLSIAFAVMEKIHNTIKARTLFATHYHELTELEGELKRLICHTLEIQNFGDNIIFMYRVILGKAAQSYGIHVAKSAGIPQDVIQRATFILGTLISENAFKKR